MPFDAILAHHAEAAIAALLALSRPRPPIIYCAHTLLEQELPLYFTGTAADRVAGRFGPRPALASIGGAIDRWIARHADGWIALTRASARVMAASSSGLGRRIEPPVSDPQSNQSRPVGDARILEQHGLTPHRYFLYSGNLDPYQDLALLEAVARGRREARSEAADMPIIVATHAVAEAAGNRRADPHAETDALRRRLAQAGVRVVEVGSSAEARALIAGARATIVPRRSLGGFPIKLANSLAAGAPVVAFHGDEWGLVDGRDVLVADPTTPVESLARSLVRLESDSALAERLGAGARGRYETAHRPAVAATATLELIRDVVSRIDA